MCVWKGSPLVTNEQMQVKEFERDKMTVQLSGYLIEKLNFRKNCGKELPERLLKTWAKAGQNKWNR